MHPLGAAGVVNDRALVEGVLHPAGPPQIATSVVQAVPIPMIAIITPWELHEQSVHGD